MPVRALAPEREQAVLARVQVQLAREPRPEQELAQQLVAPERPEPGQVQQVLAQPQPVVVLQVVRPVRVLPLVLPHQKQVLAPLLALVWPPPY